MSGDTDLLPVQKWYLDELTHLGEYGKYAEYKTESFTIHCSRSAIIEVHLDGEVSKLFDAETPKYVKDNWNDLGVKSVKLINEAMEAHKHLGSPSLEKYEEEELPQFLRDDATVTGTAMRLTNSGWYQNSSGDLYHYDGVVWDNVPSEKIDSLEFLGG